MQNRPGGFFGLDGREDLSHDEWIGDLRSR